MSQETKMEGDRIIEVLERGQHWVTENVKLLVGVFIVIVILAYGNEVRVNSATKHEVSLWEASAELKSLREIEQFVDTNAGTDAGRFMALQLIRKELDASKWEKAISYASRFIEKNQESPHLNIAFTLRAYAYEESGKLEEAKVDYKKASELAGATAVIASKAFIRLDK